MSTARTFPPQEGGNSSVKTARRVRLRAGLLFLLLTDFVCRRVLRTLHFFRGLCSTHGVSQRFLLVLYEAEVACCSGRFFGASSHGAEPQN